MTFSEATMNTKGMSALLMALLMLLMTAGVGSATQNDTTNMNEVGDNPDGRDDGDDWIAYDSSTDYYTLDTFVDEGDGTGDGGFVFGVNALNGTATNNSWFHATDGTLVNGNNPAGTKTVAMNASVAASSTFMQTMTYMTTTAHALGTAPSVMMEVASYSDIMRDTTLTTYTTPAIPSGTAGGNLTTADGPHGVMYAATVTDGSVASISTVIGSAAGGVASGSSFVMTDDTDAAIGFDLTFNYNISITICSTQVGGPGDCVGDANMVVGDSTGAAHGGDRIRFSCSDTNCTEADFTFTVPVPLNATGAACWQPEDDAACPKGTGVRMSGGDLWLNHTASIRYMSLTKASITVQANGTAAEHTAAGILSVMFDPGYWFDDNEPGIFIGGTVSGSTHATHPFSWCDSIWMLCGDSFNMQGETGDLIVVRYTIPESSFYSRLNMGGYDTAKVMLEWDPLIDDLVYGDLNFYVLSYTAWASCKGPMKGSIHAAFNGDRHHLCTNFGTLLDSTKSLGTASSYYRAEWGNKIEVNLPSIAQATNVGPSSNPDYVTADGDFRFYLIIEWTEHASDSDYLSIDLPYTGSSDSLRLHFEYEDATNVGGGSGGTGTGGDGTDCSGSDPAIGEDGNPIPGATTCGGGSTQGGSETGWNGTVTQPGSVYLTLHPDPTVEAGTYEGSVPAAFSASELASTNTWGQPHPYNAADSRSSVKCSSASLISMPTSITMKWYVSIDGDWKRYGYFAHNDAYGFTHAGNGWTNDTGPATNGIGQPSYITGPTSSQAVQRWGVHGAADYKVTCQVVFDVLTTTGMTTMTASDTLYYSAGEAITPSTGGGGLLSTTEFTGSTLIMLGLGVVVLTAGIALWFLDQRKWAVISVAAGVGVIMAWLAVNMDGIEDSTGEILGSLALLMIVFAFTAALMPFKNNPKGNTRAIGAGVIAALLTLPTNLGVDTLVGFDMPLFPVNTLVAWLIGLAGIAFAVGATARLAGLTQD